MSDSMLERTTIEPKVPAKACVIWLHGLGDSGAGFAPVVPALGLQADHAIRFVFPHAQEQPVTINGGYVMRAWYDIKSMDLHDRADMAGVKQSEQQILRLIAEQISSGIPSENIVLAGFSQGGVMSLFTALRLQKKLAGIMALSCYLPSGDSLPDAITDVNQTTPILQHHGVDDEVVPLNAGQVAHQLLSTVGFNCQWQEYKMGHSVVPEQLRDISTWLQTVLDHVK